MKRKRHGAYARASDPSTSHEAAALVEANRLERVVLDYLRVYGPMTMYELAGLSKVEIQTITPRFHPLQEKGLIHDTGQKKKNPSGKRAIIWSLGPDPLGPLRGIL